MKGTAKTSALSLRNITSLAGFNGPQKAFLLDVETYTESVLSSCLFHLNLVAGLHQGVICVFVADYSTVSVSISPGLYLPSSNI